MAELRGMRRRRAAGGDRGRGRDREDAAGRGARSRARAARRGGRRGPRPRGRGRRSPFGPWRPRSGRRSRTPAGGRWRRCARLRRGRAARARARRLRAAAADEPGRPAAASRGLAQRARGARRRPRAAGRAARRRRAVGRRGVAGAARPTWRGGWPGAGCSSWLLAAGGGRGRAALLRRSARVDPARAPRPGGRRRARRGGRRRASSPHRLYDETEGLPLFVVEYLAALGADPDGALPAGVRELLPARLEPVSETAAQVLAAAAVIGRSFDVDTRARGVRPRRGGDGRPRSRSSPGAASWSRAATTTTSPTSSCGGSWLRAARASRAGGSCTAVWPTRCGAATAPAALIARHLRPPAATPRRPPPTAAPATARGRYSPARGARAPARRRSRSATPSRARCTRRSATCRRCRASTRPRWRPTRRPRRTRRPRTSAAIEHRIGQVRHRRGDWELASATFEAARGSGGEPAARACRPPPGWRTAAAATRRRAELAERARALAEAAGDPRPLAQAHNMLGMLAPARRGPPRSASLELAEPLADPARASRRSTTSRSRSARAGEYEPRSR